MKTIHVKQLKFTPEQWFMGSVILVNGGNYLYNLLLGRILGPAEFADAALQITLLLVLSFLGMTFQLGTARFAADAQDARFSAKYNLLFKQGMRIGIAISILLLVFSKQLAVLFHAKSAWMFISLGIGVPLYFGMSVKRGLYQGKQQFKTLSVSYQAEMWSRLFLTLMLVMFSGLHSSISVALGILISFGFGWLPRKKQEISKATSSPIEVAGKKRIMRFMLITAGYELTQIIINNSDILLVKHYFDNTEAGMYSALALIGRVVYFMAWMFVMLLLPKVVQKHKAGEQTSPILLKYLTYIGGFAAIMVLGCLLFPQTIIKMMFGAEYLSMAPLLYKYALATSLFALANIFAYYFLSLDQYVPVLISGLFGLLQVLLITLNHSSLLSVVHMQIAAMTALLAFQVSYYLVKMLSTEKENLLKLTIQRNKTAA